MTKQNTASIGNSYQQKYDSFTVKIFFNTSLFCCFTLSSQVLLLVKGWVYWLLTAIADMYPAFGIPLLFHVSPIYVSIQTVPCKDIEWKLVASDVMVLFRFVALCHFVTKSKEEVSLLWKYFLSTAIKSLEILNSNKFSLYEGTFKSRTKIFEQSLSTTSDFVGSFQKNLRSDFILTQDQNKIVNDGSLKSINEIKIGDKIKPCSKCFPVTR